MTTGPGNLTVPKTQSGCATEGTTLSAAGSASTGAKLTTASLAPVAPTANRVWSMDAPVNFTQRLAGHDQKPDCVEK